MSASFIIFMAYLALILYLPVAGARLANMRAILDS